MDDSLRFGQSKRIVSIGLARARADYLNNGFFILLFFGSASREFRYRRVRRRASDALLNFRAVHAFLLSLFFWCFPTESACPLHAFFARYTIQRARAIKRKRAIPFCVRPPDVARRRTSRLFVAVTTRSPCNGLFLPNDGTVHGANRPHVRTACGDEKYGGGKVTKKKKRDRANPFHLRKVRRARLARRPDENVSPDTPDDVFYDFVERYTKESVGRRISDTAEGRSRGKKNWFCWHSKTVRIRK